MSGRRHAPDESAGAPVETEVRQAGGSMAIERRRRMIGGLGLVVAAIVGATVAPRAQAPAPQRASDQVTFTKDIAPILQRSCQQCHNPEGGAPMSLLTYEEVRPYARAIKTRT